MTEQHQARLSHKTLYVLGAIAGLVILLLAMQGRFTHKVQPGTTVYAENPLASDQMTATARQVEDAGLLSWPGQIIAETGSRLAPKLAGRIVEITVQAGDKVKRGQVLARIEASELQARVAAARAAVTAAEAQAVRTRADDQRIRHLYTSEAATRQELDASTAAAVSTAAHASEARERLRAVESQLGDAVITAPYEGLVIRRIQEPGDMAQPGSPILTLQQSGGLSVEASLPVRCAGFLHTGNPVTVRLMQGDTALMATITEIQPAADPATHTVRIKARMPDAPEFRAGMPAHLQLGCGSERHLMIPEAAVTRSGQLESVQWVNPEGFVRLRHVRTGKRAGGEVEILAGLEPGDRVVLKPGVRP